jgi:hypothetical protein
MEETGEKNSQTLLGPVNVSFFLFRPIKRYIQKFA